MLRTITHFNPIFYLIDGLRYGVIGVSDSNPVLGLAVCLGAVVVVCSIGWMMFRTGYRLKS